MLTEICVTRGWCLGVAGDDIVRNALDKGVDAVVDALICQELGLPTALFATAQLDGGSVKP